ncbi:hypothetical protein [Paenibacillus mucilaginosus]|uniref:Uncharacterized protein n=1 Tax=Paenibacillus mucilaginosus (strain KNP414) TaxID=1036673 RepID=F8FHN9_PAEMK|nr:hypothetical protein [Paenibacillus mucilaginosus]AEI42746.1 hypothetical protein KNP414_04214 [Paenibacillus mucilaginosus KNP414]MCG7216839.1 hypothetical protein [Paenibacillus mucilaginosus]WDM30939.1 hypothetical protein KCX80_18070 [Paenibacillus mucilaginosus]
MKIELEMRAFGKVEVQGTEDAYQSTEFARVYKLPKETTIGELESLLTKLFDEVENGYSNPQQSLGKITIRAKR